MAAVLMVRACSHRGCSSCTRIVIGLIAQQLASVPEESRAGICAQALELAKVPRVPTTLAQLIEEQIG